MQSEIKDFSLSSINSYLLSTSLLQENEVVTDTSIPGEGNMNLVLRLHTSMGRTLIFKKSFDYVKKYPQVSAPINRIEIETKFYELTKKENVVTSKVPALLFYDSVNYIAIFEDLGDSKDYSFLYGLDDKLNESEFNSLIDFLISLHGISKQEGEVLQNSEMRKLNYEHIFNFPFNVNNGFDLDTVQDGLANLASVYQNNAELKKQILTIGENYLGSGNTLLHGDFYPGSWLKTKRGLKIIDAEFAFHGCAEFDLAVLIAHCELTNQNKVLVLNAVNRYKKHNTIDDKLLNSFVGVEIFRRLIGLAQLPLKISISSKKELLQNAYELITNS